MTSRLLSDYEEEAAKVAEFEERTVVQQNEIANLKEEKEELAKKVEEFDKCIKELNRLLQQKDAESREARRELGEVKEELGKRLEASAAIEEFEKKLGAVEDLKRDYESRIERLREEVKRLRVARTDPASMGADEMIEIQMGPKRQASRNLPDEGDWLETLS